MQPAKSLKLGILALLLVALTIFPGCGGTAPPINHSPTIIILIADSSSIDINQSITITSIATDQDGDALTYIWTKNGGTITGSGSAITWTAPATAGTYAITCTVSDGRGGQDSESVNVEVFELDDETKIINTIHGLFQAFNEKDWNTAKSYCVYGSEIYQEIVGAEQCYNLYGAYECGIPDEFIVNNINPIIVNGDYAEAYVYLSIIAGDIGDSGELWLYLQKINNDWRLYGAGGTTPLNNAPEITSTAVTSATVGEAYTYDVDATDPDEGDVLTYSLNAAPTGMTIVAATGVISWTPAAAGTFSVIVSVSDGELSDTQSFALTVSEAEVEPEVTHCEDVTGLDGVATFILEDDRIVRVKLIDVVTGEPISNIDSYLVTDGIDAAFLFVDPAGIYIPRIAPEEQSLESLARNSEGRIVGTIKELWKMGVAQFSGYQPKFSDQIENRLASYIFRTFFMFCYPTTLGELEFNLWEFLYEYGLDEGAGAAITAITGIIAVHSVPVVGQVLAIVGAIELGNTAAYELWVRYYKSRGYSLDQMFEIWRLKSIIAGLTVIPFVFPIEEPSYPPPEESPGSISGKVLDARTGEGIYNAQVQIVDLDRSTGTSSDGSYSFNSVPPGTYGIVATKAGYYPSVQINATVISEATTVNVNLVLSSILTSTEYRIVLTWGENPRDLDSHLWIPNGEHCYYANKTVSGANLDVDDQYSYGPETITITNISSGTYTYAVKHYAGTGKITTSGAKVEIYNDSGKIRTYEVNPNASCGGVGWYWTVFELDGNSGIITTINTFGSSSPRSINDKELLFEKK